ncbi:MAG: ATP-dependent helicase HrpB [Verrucomicrobiota bacterium]
MPDNGLPIWRLHADLVRTLTEGNQLVLVAATGSGKTTQVPQMILDAGLVPEGRQIVVLQPRRVAARTVATRVAWERQSRLGAEVGYQVRFEDRIGDATRIAFVTEGILLRWLQDDPMLARIGVLIFDEFHERNLLSDVALALAKRLQATERPDLRLVVMSATLEAEPVARYLAAPRPGPGLDTPVPAAPSTPPAAPILVSEGRTFPVEMRWLDYGDSRPVHELAADKVERIVESGWEGDILVFMPGKGEIQATLGALSAARLGERVALIPLHGELAPEDQDRAFQPSAVRKIVVSTNVAETSVTIDGIRHVVDGGLARMARYDAERGIQTLMVEEISRASADQRAGRAGRTAPGTCWRLWTESGHLNRPARNTPEIQRADLAEVVLLLHSLGVRQAATFDWLDAPDKAAVLRAERLLHVLGALEGADDAPEGSGFDLTPVGRQMLRLPMHPRFARLLVEASRRGCVPAACLCAALVSGRDLLMRVNRDDRAMTDARELFEGSTQSDFHTLLRAHQYARNAHFSLDACRRHGIHAQTARQVEDTFQQLVRIAEREGMMTGGVGGAPAESGDEALLKSLCAGFVDQVCVRKDSGSLDCLLTEGRAGSLMRESVVQQAELMVVGSIREVSGRTGGVLTLLGLATAVKVEWLRELFPQHFRVSVEHVFDRLHKRVSPVRRIRFLDLVVATEHQKDADPAQSGRCLAEAFARGGFDLPQLDHELKQFIARVNLMARALPQLEFPAFDGAALVAALDRAFHGLTLVKQAQSAPLKEAFRAHLAPEQIAWLDELMPVHLPWIEGYRLKLTYLEPDPESDPEAIPGPEAQVKLTECFQLKAHPTVGEDAIPVRLALQAPDGKRLEVVSDFPRWREVSYPKLRSQLRAKYPGFVWP